MNFDDPEKLDAIVTVSRHSNSSKEDALVYIEEGVDSVGQQGGLQRKMKTRHIQMIAIGSVIGTGLFVGTANTLMMGGPASLLISYVAMSLLTWSLMVSVGETASHLPVPGAMITHAQIFVDKSLSFTQGWMYCMSYFFTQCSEYSAAATLVHFWTDANYAEGSVQRSKSFDAIWITLFILFSLSINIWGANVFGELEFWACIFKVLLCVGWMILGIILAAGGGPQGHATGFDYWHHPGPFTQYLGIDGSKGRFLGFWYVCCQTAFAFLGTELCIMASAEVKSPKRAIPRAVKSVYIRIILFYIISVFFITMLVPYDDPHLKGESTGAKSPMVIAVRAAGINSLPSIINAVIISSALSSGTANPFGGSRTLYGLALNGNAPRIFTKVTKRGVPIYAVLIYIILSCITYMVCSQSSSTVFEYFVSLTSTTGILNWCTILFVYLRFYYAMRAQGFDRKQLPYRGPFQPFTAIFGLIFGGLIAITNGFTVFINGQWDTPTFVTSYFPLAFYIFLYVSHKVISRCKIVNLREMDLYEGSYAEEDETHKVENPIKKIAKGIFE